MLDVTSSEQPSPAITICPPCRAELPQQRWVLCSDIHGKISADDTKQQSRLGHFFFRVFLPVRNANRRNFRGATETLAHPKPLQHTGDS